MHLAVNLCRRIVPVAMLAMGIMPHAVRAQLQFGLSAPVTSNYADFAAGRTDQYARVGDGTPGFVFGGPDFLDRAPSGVIPNYSASLGPFITTDLDQYRFNASLLVSSFDPNTRTATYTGDFGIFYNYNRPGDVFGAPANYYVALGTLNLTSVFVPDYSTADVTGTLVVTSGPLQPPGFPGPISFADKYGPGTFTGTLTSDNQRVTGLTSTLTGTVRAEVIPEPATGALVLSGLLPLAGAVLRRRRRA